MTTNHPITPPPPEVVRSWWSCIPDDMDLAAAGLAIATEAARWGADQELEACCEWAAEQDRGFDLELRAARRPAPPSLKEQALAALAAADGADHPVVATVLTADQHAIIRRALEQLDD